MKGPLRRARLIIRLEYETAPVRAVFRALELCDWQPPVDPDLLIAREAVALDWERRGSHAAAARVRFGDQDSLDSIQLALAAIKLYKSRTGA